MLYHIKGQNTIRVATNGRPVLDIPLQPVIDRVVAYRKQRNDYQVPMNLLRSQAAAGSAAGEIYLTNPYATRTGGQWVVSTYSGELFLRLR